MGRIFLFILESLLYKPKKWVEVGEIGVFLNEKPRASLSERDISSESLNQNPCIIVDVSYVKTSSREDLPLYFATTCKKEWLGGGTSLSPDVTTQS
jgi:hypothetical protein